MKHAKLRPLFMFVPIFFLFLNLSAQAQEAGSNGKFYLKAYGGYGLLTPGSFRLTSYSTDGSSNKTYSVGNTGLGAGIHYGGGIGYILNDFLNIGIDADYLKNKDLKSTSVYNGGSSGMYIANSTIKCSILSLVPNITFKAISTPSYYIYNRIGILIAISTKSSLTEYDTAMMAGPTYSGYTAITNFNYGISVGAQAALGIQFGITNDLKGFAEIIGNYLPISPNSSVQNSMNNSYDKTNTLTSNIKFPQINTSYSTSGTDSPNSRPKTFYNVNYIGINVGVTYKF